MNVLLGHSESELFKHFFIKVSTCLITKYNCTKAGCLLSHTIVWLLSKWVELQSKDVFVLESSSHRCIHRFLLNSNVPSFTKFITELIDVFVDEKYVASSVLYVMS